MDPRLSDLYKLPQDLAEQDIYLQDLAAHCAHLENRVLGILDSLCPDDRAVIEDYIEARNELEYQSVKRALKIGKAHAQTRKLSSYP